MSLKHFSVLESQSLLNAKQLSTLREPKNLFLLSRWKHNFYQSAENLLSMFNVKPTTLRSQNTFKEGLICILIGEIRCVNPMIPANSSLYVALRNHNHLINIWVDISQTRSVTCLARDDVPAIMALDVISVSFSIYIG